MRPLPVDSIPPRRRSSCNNSRVDKQPKPPNRPSRLRKLINDKKIESPKIASLVPVWRGDPAQFFRPAADQVKQSNLHSTSSLVLLFLLEDTGKKGHSINLESKQQNDIATTQRRFRMMGAWMLKSIFHPEDIPFEVIERLTSMCHGLSTDEVEENFKTSSAIGQRYCRFIANFNEPDVVMALSDEVIPRST